MLRSNLLLEPGMELYNEDAQTLSMRAEDDPLLSVKQEDGLEFPSSRVVVKTEVDADFRTQQMLYVKQEEGAPLDVPYISVKTEDFSNEAYLLKQEPPRENKEETIGEQFEGKPSCSFLQSDKDEQNYNTDNSEDWEPPAKRLTTCDGQESNSGHIEDSETGRASDHTIMNNYLGEEERKPKEHKCPECGKISQCEAHLQRHMLMHTGQKPYNCPDCNKAFRYKSSLKIHLNVHKEEMPLSCSVCRKGFTQARELRRHMVSHTDEKPFSCPECDLSFKHKHNLCRHISTIHREEKPYSCPLCEKAFAQKFDFMSHMRTHSGERPFSCTICNRSFGAKGTLKTHMKVHRKRGIVQNEVQAILDIDENELKRQYSKAFLQPMGEEEDLTGQEEDEDFRGQEEDEMGDMAFEQFDEENFAAENFSASFDNSSDEENMEENDYDNDYKDDEEWKGGKSLTTGPWKSKNKAIIWSPTPLETSRYVPAPILKPGITHFAESRINTPESAFGLMMTDEIIQLILKYTNLQGSRGKGVWREVDETELHAYIGLFILTGVFKAPHESTASLWDKETGRTIFAATMSRNRFQDINSNLRFDDPLTRSARMERDKLAPISRLWSLWSHRLPLLFKPERDLCMGTQIVPFKGNCAFRQYVPNRPGKYGLKIWTLCDVKTLYALKTQVDTGKSSDIRENNDGMRLTLELTDGLKGYTITTDKRCASIGLADELLKRKMTLVGAIKKNRAELPVQLLNTRERETMSSMFAFNRNKTLISYVPKRSKNVLILSTKHRDPEKEKKGKKRPQALLDYYRCKGAVDNLDKFVSTYSCRRTTHYWAQALFYNIIDVSAHNALVLFLQIDPTWNQDTNCRKRCFLEALGKSLVAPAIAARQVLPRAPAVASMVQSIQEQAEIVVEPGRKRRQCGQCTERRRVQKQCGRCKDPLCKDHIIYVCLSCYNK